MSEPTSRPSHASAQRGARAPRVDRVEASPVMDALQQVVEEDRVCFSRVRPPEENDVRFLDLAVGVRTPTRPKHSRQTGDARGVSGTVTTVDVVAADHDASELLGDEVHLVRGLGATEHPERARAMPIDGLAQSLRRRDRAPRPIPPDAACPRRGPAAPSAWHIARLWSWISSFAPISRRSLVKSGKVHCTRMGVGLKPALRLQGVLQRDFFSEIPT